MNKVIKELQTAIIKSCGNGRAALGKDANVMRELMQWKLAVRIPGSTQNEEGADNRITVYTQTVAVPFSHCRQMGNVWAATRNCPWSRQMWHDLCPPYGLIATGQIGSTCAWQPACGQEQSFTVA